MKYSLLLILAFLLHSCKVDSQQVYVDIPDNAKLIELQCFGSDIYIAGYKIDIEDAKEIKSFIWKSNINDLVNWELIIDSLIGEVNMFNISDSSIVLILKNYIDNNYYKGKFDCDIITIDINSKRVLNRNSIRNANPISLITNNSNYWQLEIIKEESLADSINPHRVRLIEGVLLSDNNGETWKYEKSSDLDDLKENKEVKYDSKIGNNFFVVNKCSESNSIFLYKDLNGDNEQLYELSCEYSFSGRYNVFKDYMVFEIFKIDKSALLGLGGSTKSLLYSIDKGKQWDIIDLDSYLNFKPSCFYNDEFYIFRSGQNHFTKMRLPH